MQTTLTISHMLVRITGVLQLILGLLMWTEPSFFYVRMPHMVLGVVFVPTVLSVVLREPGFAVWLAITRLLVTAITPIVQYAWTFFYLRLVETDAPLPIISSAMVAAIGSGEVIGGRLRRNRLGAAAA